MIALGLPAPNCSRFHREGRIEGLQNAVVQVDWAGERVALIPQQECARAVLGDAAISHNKALERPAVLRFVSEKFFVPLMVMLADKGRR
jgi:hypothetical protein